MADGIRIAGKEVSIAAGQVRSFSTLLMSIHNEVSKPTQISPFEQTLILDIVSVYWPDATFDKFTASTWATFEALSRECRKTSPTWTPVEILL